MEEENLRVEVKCTCFEKHCKADRAMQHKETCEWKMEQKKRQVKFDQTAVASKQVAVAPLSESPAVVLEKRKLEQRMQLMTLGKRKAAESTIQVQIAME